MLNAKKIALGTIALFLFPFFSYADYIPVQNFAQPVGVTNSNRNEYVNKSAFSYIATSTHKVDNFTFVLFDNGGLGSETIFVTATLGSTNPIENRLAYGTSTSVTVDLSTNDTATTTVTFSPALQASAGVTLSFFFHSEDVTNNTILFTPENPTKYPAYIYNYLGSGQWELGTVVSANYGASYFTTFTTGSPPAYQICGPNNPYCNATIPPVNPECGLTDIGACIGNAFAWAFLPSAEDWLAFRSLSFASTSPIGYVYDIAGLFSNFASSTASTTISISLASFNFDDNNPMFATSSFTILSANVIQATIGPDWWNFIQLALGGAVWLIFIVWVLRRAENLV